MTAAELEKLLTSHGFQLVSQRGSHRKWRHPQSHRQVVVPEHAGRFLPTGTQRAILKAADIDPEQLRG